MIFSAIYGECGATMCPANVEAGKVCVYPLNLKIIFGNRIYNNSYL